MSKSSTELKAHAYDLLAKVEFFQRELQNTNKLISEALEREAIEQTSKVETNN